MSTHLLGAGLVSSAMRDVSQDDFAVFPVRARDRRLAFLSGILEASEGLGMIHGDRGGEVIVVTPHCRAAELRELLDDLEREWSCGVEGES
jgi:Domain of unknown function (DUF4911)